MSAQIIQFAEARDHLQVAEVMTLTADAYSRAAYGEIEWAKCAALLLSLGYSAGVASDLLMSRLTRFARDCYDATAEGFAQFLASPGGERGLAYELAA